MLVWSRLDVNGRNAILNRWPQSTIAQRTAGRLRVLYLGNSFTQYNGGQALILQRLVESAGIEPRPVIDQVTRFGATWKDLWDRTKGQDEVRQGGWDFVVLQDYSTASFEYRTEMADYGSRWATEVRKVGAKPLYFMTWAYMDAPDAQPLIAASYATVGRANHATVCPVGLAWATTLRRRPDLILHYGTDHKHPTPTGSYLTGCVFYSLFLHRSPHGLTGHVQDGGTVYVDLPPETAAFLQDVAWETVRAYVQPSTGPAATAPMK